MNRTVLITGGSRGIGAAIAERFDAEKYDFLIPTREEMDLESIHKYTLISKPTILINNAALNEPAPFESVSHASWWAAFQTNVFAPAYLAQQCIPAMRAQKWGRIINLGSVYGIRGKAGRSAYGASKAALMHLTRSLALEHARDGILVNTVCPGFVDTEMTRKNNPDVDLTTEIPLGRLAKPEEIAELVYFLCSEKNTYITGQTITIDGGMTA